MRKETHLQTFCGLPEREYSHPSPVPLMSMKIFPVTLGSTDLDLYYIPSYG